MATIRRDKHGRNVLDTGEVVKDLGCRIVRIAPKWREELLPIRDLDSMPVVKDRDELNLAITGLAHAGIKVRCPKPKPKAKAPAKRAPAPRKKSDRWLLDLNAINTVTDLVKAFAMLCVVAVLLVGKLIAKDWKAIRRRK